MKRVLLSPLFSILLLGCGHPAHLVAGPATFYVAVNGNDGWSGHRPSADATQSDGPFATLSRALAAARAFKGQSVPAGDESATIVVRGGLYSLAAPLVLTPEDSGVTLAAYKNEQPILSGGRRIDGWQESSLAKKRVWTAEIPQAREGKWFFRELWVNGQRAVRARYPNHGYLKVAEVIDKAPEWSAGQSRFRFHPGDLQAWQSVTDAEVVVMNRWVESRLPVSSVDESRWIVSFSKKSVFALEEGDLYYLEGALEALDEPGEWFLDKTAGQLWYMPRPGEALNSVQAIAPVLPQVMRLEGRPEAGQYVERVTMRGLTFAHAEWCFPEKPVKSAEQPSALSKPEAGGFGQAAIGVPGAVWGEGVRQCVFNHCSFLHAGTYGLALARGCQENRITHCEFADLGAGGLKLGEEGIRDKPGELARGNEVSDCHIHDGGQMFQSAIGIWIGQSPNNRLLHNLIHDFYYTGISVGWTWGYGPALATNNLIAFNHVHHIGVKSNGDGPILSDMGGIYTLGMQPGTQIHNNLWHDIAGRQYGGWGIYFDEGSSSIIARSNVVYRTTHGGFHQHYGATNRVENNVFAFARDQQIQRSRSESHTSFRFATNIVYFDQGVLLGSEWTKDRFELDWNVYWDARAGARPEGMRFAGASLEQWQKRGHDLHSLIVDPLFVGAKRNDFRLKSRSSALKLGFQPIDLRPVGISAPSFVAE